MLAGAAVRCALLKRTALWTLKRRRLKLISAEAAAIVVSPAPPPPSRAQLGDILSSHK